jgi:predicted LPLAT superfamily acyltransferase
MVDDIIARGEGCFLLGAHLGSFEIVRALGRNAKVPPMNLVMYEENARKLNSVLDAINPDLPVQVIALGKVDSMLKVEAALARGELVGMLGDRTIAGEGTVQREFLGEQATLPLGPLRIAIMLKRPIVLMFGLYRGGKRYDIHFEVLADMRQLERSEREGALDHALNAYLARIEHYCRLYPYNWFNFYDFWR